MKTAKYLQDYEKEFMVAQFRAQVHAQAPAYGVDKAKLCRAPFGFQSSAPIPAATVVRTFMCTARGSRHTP
jgi:hypothetical protein